MLYIKKEKNPHLLHHIKKESLLILTDAIKKISENIF